MKTFSSLKILKNDYLILVLILILGYVLNNTTFDFARKINFVIVTFMLYLPRFNKDNTFYYALIFGLFNDFIMNFYIGLSVILFIILSLVQILSKEFFSLSSLGSKLLVSLSVLLLFTIFNMFYFGYTIGDFADYGIFRMAAEYVVYLIIFFILEFRRAFSHFER